MDGILNVNKPAGMTSFRVVAAVKRWSGEGRVGHAGTLDPAATGVLPVCLGRATRVTRFLMDATKVYKARIELGVATDTYDASGKVVQTGDTSGIDQPRVEVALSSFCGLIQQTPPAYSAVKHRGKPLYRWARAGIEVERKSRPARIYSLEVTGWEPPLFTLEVVCGKGTYIRSLAHDLGQVLGCGANLKGLVRLKCGIFDIEDSIPLAKLEEAFLSGYWTRFVYPPDSVLAHWAAVVVGDEDARLIRNGRPVALEKMEGKGHCRAYTTDGCFLAVLGFDSGTGQWRPERVFAD